VRQLVHVVSGIGARGHLGLSALGVTTAMRACQLEPRAAPFPDRTGSGAGIARAELLPTDVVGLERFVALGAPALREATFGAGRVGLVLALPDADRPDQADPRFGEPLLALLARGAGVDLARGSRVVRRGHAGFGFALAEARAWLDGGEIDEVVVGGIDTPFHADVVRWLDERGWLCREDDDAGRIPSEAAAFVRLARKPENAAAPWGRPKAVDTIEGPVDDWALNLGKLMRRVAIRGRDERVGWILPDLNGERPRTERWAKALEIAHDRIEGAYRDDPVQHLGDTGAATGALLTVVAIQLARIGAVATPEVMIPTSSDAGSHAAMLWELPGPSGPFVASRTDVRDHVVTIARGAIPATADESRQMRRLARSCLEDIGSMGLLLAPEPAAEGDPTAFGQRLLDAFDALAAIGFGTPGATYEPDLRAIVDAYFAETPEPDRARRFAVAFTRSHLVPRPAAPPRSARSARRTKRG
jgi:3-oxoacyl-[acyl-carrier-protein] synthase-1